MVNNFFKSLVFLCLVSIQSFSESLVNMTGASFVEHLNSSTGGQTKIVGKNNGPSGQLCTIEILRGQGRSLSFQTVLKITETDVYGRSKLPVQINLLHSQVGYYGSVNNSEGHMQYFQFTSANIKNEATMTKNAQSFALHLQSSMLGKTISSYCFVPKLQQ